MTEPGDPVARRYRELAREEPGASLDDAILAASRRAAGARPGGKRTGAARWMGPVSIAAVLVLGIGVSLRMQLEKPGIETSMPTQSSGEYALPPSAEAPPPPQAKPPAVEEQKLARKERAASEIGAAARPDTAAGAPAAAPAPVKKADKLAADTAKPLAKRIEIPAQPAEAEAMRNRAEPNPFTDAPVVMQQAPGPASPPSVAMTTPAASPPPPAPAPAPASRAASPAVVAEARAPAAAGASAPAAAAEPQAQLRAKREGVAADNSARESRAIGSLADADPTRELERIARLREAGRHADADRAIEEFRRRHPDYRIPEAVWERVRPR